MPENSPFFPQLMQRYSIYDPLPGVDQKFITALLHAFEEETFCAANFDPFPIAVIVEYIKRTHVFYLQTKLPEIEQSISLLSELYASDHPILVVLHEFFRRYCRDLTTHIRAEETKLLPYIALLHRCLSGSGDLSEYLAARRQCSVAGFLAEHHDTEDELKDVRRTIRLYEPPVTNESLYRVLLTQLQTFEEDLCVHALIEDHVLIPKAREMEGILDNRLGGTRATH